jgi:hypothetical protein
LDHYYFLKVCQRYSNVYKIVYNIVHRRGMSSVISVRIPREVKEILEEGALMLAGRLECFWRSSPGK